MMHTEIYCKTLESLDPVKAIRAIQEAYLQLDSLAKHCDIEPFDNAPAMESLAECLREAGHMGFTA